MVRICGVDISTFSNFFSLVAGIRVEAVGESVFSGPQVYDRSTRLEEVIKVPVAEM